MKIKKLERNIKTGVYTIVFLDGNSQQTIKCTELARKEMGDVLNALISVAVDVAGLDGGAMKSVIITGAVWKYDKFDNLSSVELLGKYYIHQQYLKIAFPALSPFAEQELGCYGKNQFELIEQLYEEGIRYLNGDRAQMQLENI